MGVWSGVAVLALVVGLALLYARVRGMAREIDNLRAYSFRQRDKISLLEVAAQNALQRLHIDIAEQKGTLVIDRHMPVGEIINKHIKAMETLAAFKIRGCGNGTFDPRMTLESAARDSNADLVGVLVALNDLVAPPPPAPPATPLPEMKVVTQQDSHAQS